MHKSLVNRYEKGASDIGSAVTNNKERKCIMFESTSQCHEHKAESVHFKMYNKLIELLIMTQKDDSLRCLQKDSRKRRLVIIPNTTVTAVDMLRRPIDLYPYMVILVNLNNCHC